MDKKYSDAEQYSKHDRDSHEADNARILFLDYGFTADQIKRISETGYVFDWEGDARTDVSYCINNNLLPQHQRSLSLLPGMQLVGRVKRELPPMVSTKLEAVVKPMWECPALTADEIDSIRQFGLVEDRDLIHTAIVKFVRFYVQGGWWDHELEQALGELRTRLYTANCVNIENTVIRVMEDLK